MNKKTLVFVALLVAMTFAGSAYAQVFNPPGTWDFNVESYATDLGGTWRYDYVVWYEQWNATTNAWDGMGTGSITYSNPSAFVVHLGSVLGLSSEGSAPSVLNNIQYNGADAWAYAGLGPDFIAWQTTTQGSVLFDEDVSTWFDANQAEAYDPSVRTVTNAWQAIGNVSGSALICPATPNTPYDSTNSYMTAMYGYNVPVGWFWFESPKPPTIVNANVIDGSVDSNRVWGPSPELNSLSLLLMSLAPAGALLRRRRKR